jgi:predicted nucleotidyltransferase
MKSKAENACLHRPASSRLPGHNEVESMNQTLEFGNVHVDGGSLAEVCRRYGVKELSLFGSAVRGEMRPESDVDFMVVFEPGVRVGLSKIEAIVAATSEDSFLGDEVCHQPCCVIRRLSARPSAICRLS